MSNDFKPQSRPVSTSQPPEDLGNPNDDGCVLGTAGRDEDPNACTTYAERSAQEPGENLSQDDRGLPGYPPKSEGAPVRKDTTSLAQKHHPDRTESEETPEQDND
ncbi:hypothetical protein [Pseudomonas fluorescens]|uniref:Uncharacterized protein n=1 Tax=Pseudomonas fluorescens TaxID=294 RepID=A0A5E7EK51_PSEFL|nr:hypothetical protein [Pseudomonas fluorescens]VVO27130.1 hypothetical protein PS723_04691 [Pseudomonas fluorescens]